MKNWRPISLINNDYKLIMALLSGRLSPVLDEVIGEEQVGFLGGRSIFDPFLAVKAALIQHQPVSRTGFLLLIDLEKAYDRVNQNFLFRVLEKFGLPPSWIGALSVLYAASTSKILVNGYESETVHLGRGVRQGCPLSPFLFLFAIEPLACLILSSSRIRCIRFGPELCLKVALYELYSSITSRTAPSPLRTSSSPD